VISPTRELAEQTCRAFNDLGGRTGLQSLAIYGGVGMEPQLRGLRDGVEIVVGCPGRMLDHLWKGTLDFTSLEVLVIDEADRMFDMGFQPAIRDVLQCILQRRQTLLFSATMPPGIRRLVQEVLHDPVTVQIGRTLPATTVSHALYPVAEHLKTALLKEVLRRTDTEAVLVFTRTKHRAERLGRELQRSGFRAVSLHGDMTQPQRQAAFEGFRGGYFKVMVATDIAARGIDVAGISHVINCDMPEDTDAYIHRIGRTGRVDREGCAMTFVTGKDMVLVGELESLLNARLERRTLPGFDYAAPAPARDHARAYPLLRRRPSLARGLATI
jgi:ATP-dependent RNA helicase RhlE